MYNEVVKLQNIYINNFVNQVSIYPTYQPKLELW